MWIVKLSVRLIAVFCRMFTYGKHCHLVVMLRFVSFLNIFAIRFIQSKGCDGLSSLDLIAHWYI